MLTQYLYYLHIKFAVEYKFERLLEQLVQLHGVAQVALTNAQIYTPLQTLYASSTGIESTFGTVNIVQAPQAEADDSGQFGINLSGYADNIGSGVEWGLYYNNSHSNTPWRITM